MREADLTDEVLVLAELARQKALAQQHTVLFDGMSGMGVDDSEALREFLEIGMDLSTPNRPPRHRRKCSPPDTRPMNDVIRGFRRAAVSV